MKILIVDDSKAMRMIVARALKQANLPPYSVVEAANGLEALSVIESEAPDVVFSDWNMPEMSGIELLKKLRESKNMTPFGFVTSESSAEVRQEALDSGARFVINKPFSPENFAAALNQAITF